MVLCGDLDGEGWNEGGRGRGKGEVFWVINKYILNIILIEIRNNMEICVVRSTDSGENWKK